MSEFWDWAVESYGREGVAQACLRLQDDHDQNVPLLLWAAWASLHGVRIDEGLAARAAEMALAWADEVIVPLREVRRRLKTALHSGDDDGRLRLRERVKAVELEAEKALMAQLETLVRAGPRLPPEHQAAALRDGLVQVHAVWSGSGHQEVLSELTQALTKG
ncbi:hypothetical protein ABAC460_19370 [Asticcacaulis sp. AC460]|uniref:TIGR02444 family protein n=1 Tax=Asticcacaulis sp. AC460 TaxID=1282360 RepID=UPI0003C3E97B|nr:TIGR02444 family protein [Asticcacaulis sp. AC460]ESQ87489.1 hypothetical protein ABAC460_19370 [Asticcacaulis sp. AC460]